MPGGGPKAIHHTLLMLAAATLSCLALACLDDSESAGGFIGVVDGQDFDVISGRAESVGDGLEIILSDAPGDSCEGTGAIEPVGNRKVILSTEGTEEGRYDTSSDGQISIQIKSSDAVFNSRTATGFFTLDTVDLTLGGEISGTIEGTTDEGDELSGSFFVSFCP